MKKFRIHLYIITMIILFALVLVPNAVLAYSFNFNVQADKTEVKPGEVVTINFAVKDINVGENGINTVEAVLKYDENIFEKVTNDSFTGANEWNFSYNDKDNSAYKGKLLGIIIKSGVTQDQAIGSVKLKAKSNIDKNVNTTNITVKDICTGNGVDIINDTDKTITIKVEGNGINNTIDNNDNVTDNNDIIKIMLIIVIPAIVIIASICIIVVSNKKSNK